jgi:hypothetical protein
VVLTCSLDELRTLVCDAVSTACTACRGVSANSSLIDKRELARTLSVSSATVARLTAEGMPHVFAGASPRYSLDDVRAWLAQRGRLGTRAVPSKHGARETIPGVRLLGRASR